MERSVVEAAVKQCERYGQEVTVPNVAANVAMNPGEYNRLILSGIKVEVSRVLRRMGYITKSEVDNSKVEMSEASLTDLKALLRIKKKNARRVQIQIDALQMLVTFLEAKKSELGYEPYVHLFEADARRIYAMHGLDLPSDWA